MKKLLFSLLAVLALTIGASQAQEVMQRQVIPLGTTYSNGTYVEFFAYCDVVFSSPGGTPVRIQYSTGVHARKINSTEELSLNVIVQGTVVPLPDYETITEIRYIWEWDFSRDMWAGLTGTGSSSATAKLSDFRYDPSLPDESPMM
ncbi:MAG: hypothetical protein LIO68_02610 [Rikenellaceae bacterium]|nr:hypothetical protein [Rikenellaceae bacterium]